MTDEENTPLELLRTERGLSRASVAAELEMSERHLYRLEKGKQSLSRMQAMAFAEFYGVEASSLLPAVAA